MNIINTLSESKEKEILSTDQSIQESILSLSRSQLFKIYITTTNSFTFNFLFAYEEIIGKTVTNDKRKIFVKLLYDRFKQENIITILEKGENKKNERERAREREYDKKFQKIKLKHIRLKQIKRIHQLLHPLPQLKAAESPSIYIIKLPFKYEGQTKKIINDILNSGKKLCFTINPYSWKINIWHRPLETNWRAGDPYNPFVKFYHESIDSEATDNDTFGYLAKENGRIIFYGRHGSELHSIFWKESEMDSSLIEKEILSFLESP